MAKPGAAEYLGVRVDTQGLREFADFFESDENIFSPDDRTKYRAYLFNSRAVNDINAPVLTLSVGGPFYDVDVTPHGGPYAIPREITSRVADLAKKVFDGATKRIEDAKTPPADKEN